MPPVATGGELLVGCRSPAALRKIRSRRTADGLPVHSFQALIADLTTLTRNRVRIADGASFEQLARPTPFQQRAFDLLGVTPR